MCANNNLPNSNGDETVSVDVLKKTVKCGSHYYVQQFFKNKKIMFHLNGKKNDEQFRYLIIEDSFEIITIVYFGAVMNGYIYYNKYRVFGHCIVPKQPNNFPGNS